MSLRTTLLALVALSLAAGAILGVQLSGATYVRDSSSTTAVGAANDWTPPEVALADPGALVSGSTTLSATATDARGVVASVVLQYAPAGTSSWVTVCTVTTGPYTCSWNTTVLADASYDLRATATDDSGYSSKTAAVTTYVANQAAAQLVDPGTNLRGSVSLSGSVTGLPGGARFTFAYAPAGTGSWTTICAQTPTFTSSATCLWSSGPLNGSYDVRVVATSTVGKAYTAVVGSRLVDNTAPTGVVAAAPAGTLKGTVALTATASDAHSGIATVEFQHRRQGAADWLTCGTTTSAPYSCSLDTTRLGDGTYELRVVATDAAGNATTSATITRSVDNTVSSVSISSPAPSATVSGDAVAVTATASSNRGVASVRIDTKPNASSTWTTLCTTTASPHTCTWNTTTSAPGSYDLRAVLVDGNANSTTSAVVTVTVSNPAPSATDIQATNGGVSGKPDAGDKLIFTYSTLVSTTSIKAGWDGSSTAVTPTFYDALAVGSSDASQGQRRLPRNQPGDGARSCRTTSRRMRSSPSPAPWWRAPRCSPASRSRW